MGRKSASAQTGVSERSVRTCLKNLQKMKNLTIKVTNKFSIITIVNWDTYQCEKEKVTSKVTNKGPTSDQQVTTNKNVKNVNNVNKELSTESSPEIFSFVENFITWSEKEHGNKAAKKTPALIKNSCGEVDKLIRIDGFTLEYIRAVLLWASKDSFWCAQIISLCGLRVKKKNGLMKFQNIAAKYDQKPKNPIEPKKFMSKAQTEMDETMGALNRFLDRKGVDCG